MIEFPQTAQEPTPWPIQYEFPSIVQLLLQPSNERVFPSSHVSGRLITPFPQMAHYVKPGLQYEFGSISHVELHPSKSA